MTSFQDKVAIITGCSSGIGLATTQLFLSRQALVFGIDIAPFTATLDEPHTQSFTFHQVDLTQPNAAEQAIAACIARYGPKIDVLANVAGIMDAFRSADTVTEAEWGRVIAINLTVPVQLMQAVLPSMKENKSGAIVNVGSYASSSGAASGVAYAASKHGLVGATKNVAWRFHEHGIRCNAVLPGGVLTNITSSVPPSSWDLEGFGTCKPVIDVHTSFKRDDLQHGCISADDVARGIAFLASDEAKMISGVLMPVDNAWSTI